ncbi:MAG TPA: SAM-dependent methyltransferase [Planctomycetaceae bacterium]|nr:SAM-dependent methyltransferase [Planctomycetaceae bacterium]
MSNPTSELKPFYDDVQAHYDLSNEFFKVFLDPSMTYSCAYFERDGMTLEEAQWAKIDLSLRKCDLHPGQKVLEIGCGWGAAAYRAASLHGVDVIGLTLSRNQHAYATQRMGGLPDGSGRVDIRLQGWDEYDGGPVDRIVSIAAFEAFRKERYTAFFEKCRSLLPEDGRMLLHTIVHFEAPTLQKLGIPLTHENVLFAKFMAREIFPGGQLCEPEVIMDHAQRAGFSVSNTQSLRLHYVRTLRIWAKTLSENKDRAIAIKDQATYDRYMKYLTGCADHFQSGHIDVIQFALACPNARPLSWQY